MAEEGKAKEGPDSTSIKAVSSLLSHFEHLSSSKPDTPSREGSPKSHKQLDKIDGTQITPVGRASLDSPRPEAWSTPGTPRLDPTQLPARMQKLESPPRSNTPSYGHKRGTVSLSHPSSPQLAPILTVDSPRSPPKGADFGQVGPRSIALDRYRNRSPEHGNQIPPSQSAGSIPISSRPVTPRSGLREEFQSENLPTGKPISSSEPPLKSTTPKNQIQPPPVNRADKPKIPGKNTSLANALESANLLPNQQRTSLDERRSPSGVPRAPLNLFPNSQRTSSDDRVSPFSTPPSSEGSPSPERTVPNSDQSSKVNTPAPNIVNQTTFKPPPVHHTIADRRQAEPPSKLKDPRMLGFTRRAETMSDLPGDRPGLPRRRLPPETTDTGNVKQTQVQLKKDEYTRAQPISVPPRPSDHSKPGAPNSMDDKAGYFPPPPKRNPTANLSRASTDLHHPRPQPLNSAILRTSHESISLGGAQSRRRAEDSEDHMQQLQPVDEAHHSRSDYPDSSQANRRSPFFKSGQREIQIKQDSRIFDVCGQYICTTGYTTRVWDLSSGEQMLLLTHGESTVKMLSVAFKPGTSLEEEGLRVWLGSNGGEIHEVDIETQSIVYSKKAHGYREVIKIYRHKDALWTLDDDGKFLVWAADESGMPNLQYSPQTLKVPKGHTFSMVVGDQLWLATGKDLRIFRPGAGDAGFQVLTKPLSQANTGDITSGTISKEKGGCVYLGHTDGKVTIYSIKDYTCLATINVSVYKINNLAAVGKYLWAGYKTGMIYVYDTSSYPWMVKKDWHAHADPVSGLLFDPSSIWKLQRLQVVSLGDDHCIRLWDGTLEEDWLEMEMQKSDVEYCEFREIGANVLTWNCGAATPSDLRRDERGSMFIREALYSNSPPEIIVFGFQELVDLEDKKLTAKSLLLGRKRNEHPDQEHMSRQYRAWRDHLTRCVEEIMPSDQPYTLLHTASLVGLFTCVFVKTSERQRITNIHAADVKRGMGGLHGNKGALVFRFVIDDSSLCFINCHLAAGQTQTMHRNNDIAAILEAESLPAEMHPTARMDTFVGGGDGAMVLDHEICILNGDLNYRIDSMPRDTVVSAVKSNQLSKLLERDQLLLSKKRNPGFRLRAFNEAPITFAPTYKYDVGTNNYDSSEKRRAPAWCDRLLYRGSGRIKQTEYRRHEVRVSDHRPVSGAFKMRVKTVSQKKRAIVWDMCLEKFEKEKRRMATEASIDYLVNILGLSLTEARASVADSGS